MDSAGGTGICMAERHAFCWKLYWATGMWQRTTLARMSRASSTLERPRRPLYICFAVLTRLPAVRHTIHPCHTTPERFAPRLCDMHRLQLLSLGRLRSLQTGHS